MYCQTNGTAARVLSPESFNLIAVASISRRNLFCETSNSALMMLHEELLLGSESTLFVDIYTLMFIFLDIKFLAFQATTASLATLNRLAFSVLVGLPRLQTGSVEILDFLGPLKPRRIYVIDTASKNTRRDRHLFSILASE